MIQQMVFAFLSILSLNATSATAGDILRPSWHNGVLGETFSFAQKIGKDAATAPRAIVTGNQLLREIDSLAPGFLAEAEKLWTGANSEQRAKIQKIVDEKFRSALLSLTVCHALDVQSAAFGWKTSPSTERLNFAVKSLLLQMAIEGPARLSVTTAIAKSEAGLMQSLINADATLRTQAEEKGQSYLEIKFDQDWKNTYSGKFSENAPTHSEPAWPALSFEFRCAKDARTGEWSRCLPSTVSELRTQLQKQLTSAYEHATRSVILNALLWRDNPSLEQNLKIILPKHFDEMYAELAPEWFKARIVRSKTLKIADAAGNALSPEVLEIFLKNLEVSKPTPGKILDSQEIFKLAIATTEKQLQTSFRATFYDLSAPLQKKPDSDWEAFAFNSPSLECGGKFSLYPCKASGKTETWFMVERRVSETDKLLPKTNPWVRDRVQATLRAKFLKLAQIVTLKKLLQRSHWIFAVSPGAKDAAWPDLAKQRTITASELFADLPDWTISVSKY